MYKTPIKPRICWWDIETSYSLIAGFDLYNQNHSHKQIVEEWYIISAAWMFEGDDKPSSISTYTKDDRKVVEKLYEVLGETDILVHHNGDKFDVKKLKARAIQLGMPPLKPVTTIDTLKVARKEFKFTSNRLDYIAKYFGVGAKSDTSSGLWLSVLMGDPNAVDEMESYNRQDVVILREVYKKLAPWMTNHPSMGTLIHGDDRGHCKVCGGGRLHIKAYKLRGKEKYPQYQCQDCGSYKTATSHKPETTETK